MARTHDEPQTTAYIQNGTEWNGMEVIIVSRWGEESHPNTILVRLERAIIVTRCLCAKSAVARQNRCKMCAEFAMTAMVDAGIACGVCVGEVLELLLSLKFEWNLRRMQTKWALENFYTMYTH